MARDLTEERHSVMSEFADKVVVIIGATGNVGSAAARRFAGEGAKLVLVSRRAAALDRLVDELNAETMVVTADLANAGEVDALVNQVEARWGQIDVLVHAAGGFAGGAHVYDPGTELLDRMWQTNVTPVYLTAGRVARHMLEKGVRGHIVVVASRSALRGGARAAAYAASKAAALRIVESLALEVRDQGIHVNAVSPSTIDSPENRAAMPKADPDKWVTPEQVVDAIVFLASAAGAGLYGANLEVYGRV